MRILFVGMPNSLHAARWVSQLNGLGWHLDLFPSYPPPVHPLFRDITVYNWSLFRPSDLDRSVRYLGLLPVGRGGNRLEWQFHRYFGGFESFALAEIIRRTRPDVVHSLGIQHGGYLTAAARRRLKSFPAWFVSNYGNDLYLFGRLESHQHRIREVLAGCDFYSAECERDVRLAREMGLRGQALPLLPDAGGINTTEWLALRQPGPSSTRRVIALKGGHDLFGRALFALRALDQLSELLTGYRVEVYQANETVRLAAELLAQSRGIDIKILPQKLPHEDILALHGRARISIGVSISDGVSNNMLEAMTMGSLPLQSDNGAEQEWIQDGQNGLLVDSEDSQGIASALRRALEDDALVDQAAGRNLEIIRARLEMSVVRPRVIEIYRNMTGG